MAGVFCLFFFHDTFRATFFNVENFSFATIFEKSQMFLKVEIMRPICFDWLNLLLFSKSSISLQKLDTVGKFF